METIAAPIAPPQPSSPATGGNVIPPPDIGKAPTPAPPADDLGDAFSEENLARVRSAVPEVKDKPAVKPPELPKDGKVEDKGKPRDETGKFAKVEEGKKPDGKKPEVKETKVETPPAPAKAAKSEDKITGWQMARKHEATIKELTAKIAEFEGKLKSAPSATPPKLDDIPEWKQVNEKLTKAEQRRQQLEDEIRWYDYEKSQEYQEKFFKPYANEYQRALGEVQSFRVNLPDGTSRAAAKEDFQTVLNSTTPAEALEKAEKLFGANASNYIAGLRTSVLRAAQAAHDAKEEFRTKGAVELKSRAEREEREATERAATFDRLNKQAAEEYPQWFKEAEGDDEGNKLLKFGNMLVDAAFGGQIEDPETKQMRDPTPDEIVRINSMIRNKAGAFDRVIHRHQLELKSKDEKIAELEAELKDYRESTPPAGGGGGKPPVVEDNDDVPVLLRG